MRLLTVQRLLHLSLMNFNVCTQECLDNLAGSNMSNVGVVYPLGLLAYLIGSRLLGS